MKQGTKVNHPNLKSKATFPISVKLRRGATSSSFRLFNFDHKSQGILAEESRRRVVFSSKPAIYCQVSPRQLGGSKSSFLPQAWSNGKHWIINTFFIYKIESYTSKLIRSKTRDVYVRLTVIDVSTFKDSNHPLDPRNHPFRRAVLQAQILTLINGGKNELFKKIYLIIRKYIAFVIDGNVVKENIFLIIFPQMCLLS